MSDWFSQNAPKQEEGKDWFVTNATNVSRETIPVRQTTPSYAGKVAGISGPAPKTTTVAGVSYPQGNDAGAKLDTWIENAKNDINNGTDTTGVGRLLKSMGAHGLDVGNAKGLLPNIGKMAAVLLGGPGTAETALPAAERTISSVIPSTKRAGATFQALRGSIGEHTVAMTDELSNALSSAKELIDAGASTPQVLNKFVTRMADLEQGPLTYGEARNFYSNMGSLSAGERLNSNKQMKRAVTIVAKALGDTINTTAASAGKLEDLQSAMKEFRHASKVGELVTSLGDLAKGRVAKYAAGTAAGGWLAKKILD